MTLRQRTTVESHQEEEWEEEEEAGEDKHENVCRGCNLTGKLFCCSTSRHAYYDDCLTLTCRRG